jgi:hypothetical protein
MHYDITEQEWFCHVTGCRQPAVAGCYTRTGKRAAHCVGHDPARHGTIGPYLYPRALSAPQPAPAPVQTPRRPDIGPQPPVRPIGPVDPTPPTPDGIPIALPHRDLVSLEF